MVVTDSYIWECTWKLIFLQSYLTSNEGERKTKIGYICYFKMPCQVLAAAILLFPI